MHSIAKSKNESWRLIWPTLYRTGSLHFKVQTNFGYTTFSGWCYMSSCCDDDEGVDMFLRAIQTLNSIDTVH